LGEHPVGELGVGPGEGLLNCFVEGGLVGLDDEQVVRKLDADQPVGKLALGVEGIGGDQNPGQVQWLQ
jgi:hypothetical protein